MITSNGKAFSEIIAARAQSRGSKGSFGNVATVFKKQRFQILQQSYRIIEWSGICLLLFFRILIFLVTVNKLTISFFIGMKSSLTNFVAVADLPIK
jgi:hypothetical protein